MKKMYKLILLLGLFGILSSCTFTQQLTIQGYPGTKIFDSNEKYLATIDYTGTTTITFDRSERYNYYLQAQSPESNVLVPFALDYVDHNRAWLDNMVLFAFCTPPVVGYLVYGIPIQCVSIKYNLFDRDFDYIENLTTNNDLISE